LQAVLTGCDFDSLTEDVESKRTVSMILERPPIHDGGQARAPTTAAEGKGGGYSEEHVSVGRR
jgi:hypothetical protein